MEGFQPIKNLIIIYDLPQAFQNPFTCPLMKFSFNSIISIFLHVFFIKLPHMKCFSFITQLSFNLASTYNKKIIKIFIESSKRFLIYLD